VRSLASLVLLLLVAGGSAADDRTDPAKAAENELRAAWLEFLKPYASAETESLLQTRQEAREVSIPHFEAAVSAAPDNVSYRSCLGYAYLSAGKYQRAKDSMDEAIRLARDDPLLYLLRAQAEAALAQMDPEARAEKVERAICSFEEAARLDPENALALIQAASVAFDSGRTDIALEMVRAALQRPGMRFYRLAIPGDLDADHVTSLNLWQFAQMGQWMEMLARAENVVRSIIKLGAAKENEGDLESAREHLERALAVARQIGNARPNVFLTVNAGLNAMEDSYASLARVAEAAKDPDLAEWQGEIGVLNIGRQELYGSLQQYIARMEDDPPSSIEELLALQGRSVAFTMLGVGLSPAEKPPPLRQPQPAREAEEDGAG
jgi:tetratricopeptide (TPR) repeat protein